MKPDIWLYLLIDSTSSQTSFCAYPTFEYEYRAPSMNSCGKDEISNNVNKTPLKCWRMPQKEKQKWEWGMFMQTAQPYTPRKSDTSQFDPARYFRSSAIADLSTEYQRMVTGVTTHSLTI
jgi:hypothetical protein